MKLVFEEIITPKFKFKIIIISGFEIKFELSMDHTIN